MPYTTESTDKNMEKKTDLLLILQECFKISLDRFATTPKSVCGTVMFQIKWLNLIRITGFLQYFHQPSRPFYGEKACRHAIWRHRVHHTEHEAE